VSPDGSTIVFELLGDLYTMPIAGGKATRISSGLALDTQPRFSPDGKRLVFVSDRGGAENLWLLEVGRTIVDTTAAADSTGLKALTKGPNTAYASPEWTPDGKYIIASKAAAWAFTICGCITLTAAAAWICWQRKKSATPLARRSGRMDATFISPPKWGAGATIFPR
jgi:Tol biopolymer transport system component